MTRVFERLDSPGPVTRAFVVGVGAYPDAKPQKIRPDGSTPAQLQNVPDLLSAGTGAALFTDWLIENADTLAAPLASVDLLLNLDLGAGQISDYSWQGRVNAPPNATDPRTHTTVDKPTSDRVKQAGAAWKNDLCQGAGNVAIFYICGHGAILGSDNIVFLSDLNADDANPWGALINIQTHASAFKVLPTIRTAFFSLMRARSW